MNVRQACGYFFMVFSITFTGLGACKSFEEQKN
jgi:hypothetical protein